MPRTSRRVAALLLLVALVAAACSSSDQSEGAGPADAAPASTAAPTTAPDTTEPPATAAPATSTAVAPTTVAPAAPTIEGVFAEVGPIVEAGIERHELNGAGLIVVDADDGVVLHEHWGVHSPDRISLVASSSKMITAGVLLRLQDDGLLDLEAPVADVVEWGAGNPEITPAQLLSNSSGLVGLAPNPVFPPYLCQFDHTTTLQACSEEVFTTEADDDRIGPPDTAFDYGGAQWQVAGGVAEAVSGRTWAELVDELYVGPCDLGALAYNNHFAQLPSGFSYPDGFDGDPGVLAATQNPNLEGGAYITTGDYGELLLMLLRDGRCGDDQVLSPEAVDAMLSDRIGEVYGGNAGNSSTGYGLGWWIDREDGYRSDPGAYGAHPWLDLEDGYGAYLVVEATNSVGQEITRELQPVIDAAMASRG